jgi:hypothetical protein
MSRLKGDAQSKKSTGFVGIDGKEISINIVPDSDGKII